MLEVLRRRNDGLLVREAGTKLHAVGKCARPATTTCVIYITLAENAYRAPISALNRGSSCRGRHHQCTILRNPSRCLGLATRY